MIAILTVGTEEWLLKDVNISVCSFNSLVACVSVMGHNVSFAIFLPDNDGSYFKNCRSIVISLILSRQQPYLQKPLSFDKGLDSFLWYF